MLWAYFDESGEYDRVTGRLNRLTLGGCIAPSNAWQQLDIERKAALRGRRRSESFTHVFRPLRSNKRLPRFFAGRFEFGVTYGDSRYHDDLRVFLFLLSSNCGLTIRIDLSQKAVQYFSVSAYCG